MGDNSKFVGFVVWEHIYIPKINEDDHLRLALWMKAFGGSGYGHMGTEARDLGMLGVRQGHD